MKKSVCILSVLSIFLFGFVSCKTADKKTSDKDSTTENVVLDSEEELNIVYPHSFEEIEGQTLSFNECWGYVSQGREYELNSSQPLTDVGYFSVGVDTYGELSHIPQRKNLKKYKGRVHLVAVCDGKALSHFVLDPQYGLRPKIIAGLIEASKDFDGLQIDYETVPANDAKNYQDFLRELKAGLGDKILSVAISARSKDLQNDVYDYRILSQIVDKILIMAYDEHWSTSAPGPIASTKWGLRVAKYAVSRIPEDKLIMGLPFYGRSWADTNPAKAWYFKSINEIYEKNDCSEISRIDNVPYFTHSVTVNVTTYFEDELSLYTKCLNYSELGIKKIGFWRIGMEDPNFFKHLNINGEF